MREGNVSPGCSHLIRPKHSLTEQIELRLAFNATKQDTVITKNLWAPKAQSKRVPAWQARLERIDSKRCHFIFAAQSDMGRDERALNGINDATHLFDTLCRIATKK
jgi:hypothetical protein